MLTVCWVEQLMAMKRLVVSGKMFIMVAISMTMSNVCSSCWRFIFWRTVELRWCAEEFVCGGAVCIRHRKGLLTLLMFLLAMIVCVSKHLKIDGDKRHAGLKAFSAQRWMKLAGYRALSSFVQLFSAAALPMAILQARLRDEQLINIIVRSAAAMQRR